MCGQSISQNSYVPKIIEKKDNHVRLQEILKKKFNFYNKLKNKLKYIVKTIIW